MDAQQITALSIVAVAVGYLARQAARSYKAFRANKAGCGSGCGKCAFAPKDTVVGVGLPTVPRKNVIALSEVRPVGQKVDNPRN
jgi:bacterioferritin-associated ferredoxin